MKYFNINTMTINRLKNMQDKVTYMLRNYPETRDNDQVLVSNMWYFEVKKVADPNEMSVYNFFKMYSQGQLPTADVITRARRKVQENDPSLRGKTWEERHKEAENVRKNIK